MRQTFGELIGSPRIGAYHYLATAILAIGIAIRLMGLDKGIWIDEYYSLRFATSQDMCKELSIWNTDPPLYFILLRLWSSISTREEFMRLLSVIFGTGALFVVMTWLKRYSDLASLLGGILWGTLPILLRYSQELRAYPLLLLATALIFFFASRLADNPGRASRCVALTLALSGAVFTQVIGVFVLASVGVYLVAKFPDYRKILFSKLLPVFAIPSAIFFYVLFFFLQWVPSRGDWWMPPFSFDLAVATTRIALGEASLLWLGQTLDNGAWAVWFEGLIKAAVIGCCGCLVLFGDWRRSWHLLAAAIVYWLQVIGYSILVTPIFWYRTVLPGLVPLIGFIALQVSTIRIAKAKWASIAALTLISLGFFVSWTVHGAWVPYETWRQAAQFLESQRQPGNLVVFYPQYIDGAIRYYAPTLPCEDIVVVNLASNASQFGAEWDARLETREVKPATVFLIVRSDANVDKDRETYRQLSRYLESRLGQPVFRQDFGIINVTQYGSR